MSPSGRRHRLRPVGLLGRSDARGAIVGLSRFHTKAHVARATLAEGSDLSIDEAVALARQTLRSAADTVHS